MWQKIFISTPFKKRNLVGLDNQDGQIAIFIALIFQVLFIFFAMLINIGLIVHDKINLQNSLDLAAYYGAERQAELLNEIAHVNYQIRQEYKLLAWRNRILGTYTYTGNTNFAGAVPLDTDLEPQQPAICVDHSGWAEVSAKDINFPINNCDTPGSKKPGVPKFNVIAGWIGIIGNTASYFDNVAAVVKAGCENLGPLNWFTASEWFYEYKMAVRKRSDLIRSLSVNLSQRGSFFNDTAGQSVIEGVRKTFLKNLTEANRNSISSKANYKIDNPLDFSFINSLSSDIPGICSNVNALGNPGWLNEIKIYPQLLYVDATSGVQSACNSQPRYIQDKPASPALPSYEAKLGAQIFAALELNNMGEPKPDVQPLGGYSSLGFEKNPWCLAYVGLKATTRPRKPFAPFGKPVALVARAFASPFGGRIGPWNMSQWANGAMASSGTPLDPLASASLGNSPIVDPEDKFVPNYSRFPGDNVGLKSKLMHYLYLVSLLSLELPKKGVLGGIRLGSYDHVLNSNNTDSLSQAPGAPQIQFVEQNLRAIENAAVAPDLFDITYYSIEPDYYATYFLPSTPISDLGSDLSSSYYMNWNIRSQMVLAKSKLIDMNVAGINWLTPNLDYLLTGWTQGRTGDYTSLPQQFANCQVHPNYKEGWPPTPGFCVAGGRTGYSVRMMARKYLQSSSLELGGVGTKGKLMNSLPGGW